MFVEEINEIGIHCRLVDRSANSINVPFERYGPATYSGTSSALSYEYLGGMSRKRDNSDTYFRFAEHRK